MSSQNQPAQHQATQPGREYKMDPPPVYDDANYKPAGKLAGKTALITGGDSGIGRAISIAYAKEGAHLAIVYLEEDKDARETKEQAEKYGAEVLLLQGDIGDSNFAQQCLDQTVKKFGKLDILVNNAAEQHPLEDPQDISQEQLERTFQTNFFSLVTLSLRALSLLPKDGAIINTSSVTAYHGNPDLVDYSATKGAITAFTRSLAINVVSQGIRVNAVAPGPIWTPLIPSTFKEEKVAEFGNQTPMKRPGQPAELAPAYVYLACNDSSYMTGQTLHINGGVIVNG